MNCIPIKMFTIFSYDICQQQKISFCLDYNKKKFSLEKKEPVL